MKFSPDFELHQTSHNNIVKLGVYCAEDCQTDKTKEIIRLIKKWLKGEKTETKIKELINNFDYPITQEIIVVQDAAYAIYSENIHDAVDSVLWARSGASDITGKYKEYVNYTKMLSYEDELWNHNFQFIPFQFNQPSTAAEVAMFLDQLEENYQDRKVFTFDNFIYNSDFELVAPIELKGENKLDLVRKIAENRLAIEYLNHLYQ